MSKNGGKQKQPKSPMPAQHQSKPGVEAKLKPRPNYKAPQYAGANKLKEKVALITGGDSGIGRAVAVLFAREGADVAFTFLKPEKRDADETIRAVEEEGQRAIALEGDVRDPKVCKRLVKKTVDEFGKLDILVNNAAFQQHQKSLEEITEEQWDQTFKTNIYGYFYMTKAALPHLEEGSAIVNTGSITGLEGSKELLDYSSTKGAIHAFTKSLAQNLVETRHSRQLRCAWASVDAVESVGQGTEGRGGVRRRHADEAAGAAGRDRACLRLFRVGSRFELRDRRNFDFTRGRNYRGLTRDGY
jgi:NAD(P)-dependent dehydrogenase (short-subunit alcohol dehydrogenase family)